MCVGTSTAIGIATAVGTGAAGIYGAHKQAETTEEALADARAQRAWQQQQYQDYLTRLQPYRDIGSQASGQMSQLLARGTNPFALTSQQLPDYSAQLKASPGTPPTPMKQG